MIFVVTGGSKGMGAATVEILKAQGHEVLNVDYDRGDICADLGTMEGRETVIKEVHRKYPDGIDGHVSNAGIAGVKGKKPSYILSVNYFGVVAVMVTGVAKGIVGEVVCCDGGSAALFNNTKYL